MRLPAINPRMSVLLNKILFYVILILFWELIYKVNVEYLKIWKPYIFPSPFNVLNTLYGLIINNTLLIAILVSLKRVIIGYSISLVLGVILGLFIVRFKYLDDNMSAMILGLQTLPSICWLPFAILWYGLNENAIIFVITIGSTFAITLAIMSGIKNVNPLYIRAARTMGASDLYIYRYVTIPASLPNVIAGMKQGWSFAWRALMAGEMLFATKGLGQILMMGRNLADMSQVMAIMIVIIFIGLSIDKLIFGRIEINVRQKWGLNKV